MAKPRAVRVASLWKQALCDPHGNLSANGHAMLSDLAAYCRAIDPPTRQDGTGAVDALATMEAVGMQKLYRRILFLLNIEDFQAMRLSIRHMPGYDEEPQI